MKKIIRAFLAICALTVAVGIAAACKETATPSEPGGTPEAQLNEITGVTFADKTETYDGTEKTVTVSGELPEGASVSYTNNKGTDAGTYSATAVLSGTGYQTKTLTATLTIGKATITGVTFTGDTFYCNGETKGVYIVGDIPAGVSVSYENNEKTEAGTYNATAVLSGANYHTLTLQATWRILPSVVDFAEALVDSFGSVPDPWAFLPSSFSKENRLITTAQIPDYSDFVSASDIPTNGMGKQLNTVYTELVRLEAAISCVTPVYEVMNTIKTLYTEYLDAEPEADKNYSGTAGGLNFSIAVTEDEYAISAAVGEASVVLYSSPADETFGARVQLTDTTVVKYEVSDDGLVIASTILDTAAVYTRFVRNEDDTVRGYIYEYLQAGGVVETATSALIEVDDTHTTLIGTKGDFIPTAVSRNCEVYRNSDGKLVGTEVREELTVSALTDTYNTLWYPLSDLGGVQSVKKLDEANGTNADTIYINGCTEDTLHTSIGGEGWKKGGSRRYDIEFKTAYFYTYDAEEEKYEAVSVEIPMLFIQEECIDDFEERFADKNETALNGESVTLNVAPTTQAAVEYGYYTLVEIYDEVSELVTFADVNAFCGVETQSDE